MLGYFAKIGLEYDEAAKEVIAPTFRHDLFRIADLAEEVARFFGYDNIPTTLPKGEATTGKLSVQTENRRCGKRYRRILRIQPGNDLFIREPEGV